MREDVGDQAESDCGPRERELVCPRLRSVRERVIGVHSEVLFYSLPS